MMGRNEHVDVYSFRLFTYVPPCCSGDVVIAGTREEVDGLKSNICEKSLNMTDPLIGLLPTTLGVKLARVRKQDNQRYWPARNT